MSLKFLPFKDNKIETNNEFGFDAYYDKNTLNWKSTGNDSNFLIEHAISSKHLNIKAASGYNLNEVITWENSLGINKDGFIDSGLGFIERESIVDEIFLEIQPRRNRMSFHFICPCTIFIPNNPELRPGFGCYLMKNGNLTDTELIKIIIDPPNLVLIASNVKKGASATPRPTFERWTTTVNSRPVLLPWNRVYLHKIDEITWVINFGIVEYNAA